MKKILLILFAFLSVNASAQYVWSSYYGNVSSFSENDQFLVEQSDSTRYVTYGQLVDFILQKYDSASFAQLNAAKLYILGDWINSIESTLTDDDNAIPTSGAVVDYVAANGGDTMVYPPAGIALSTGSAWGASITDNSTNWNTAYGWGDHSEEGYLTSVSTPISTDTSYIPYLKNGELRYSDSLTFIDEQGVLVVSGLKIEGGFITGTTDYPTSNPFSYDLIYSYGVYKYIKDSISTDQLRINNGVIVDSIETTLTDDDTHLPTSGAVLDYGNANWGGSGSGDFSYSDTTSGPLVTDYQVDTAKVNLRSEIALGDHDSVTLAGTPDYLTISGQQITRGQVDLSTDVTSALPIAGIDATGTPDGSTFLSGDGTWKGVTATGTEGSAIEIIGDSINFGGDLTKTTLVNIGNHGLYFRGGDRRFDMESGEGFYMYTTDRNNSNHTSGLSVYDDVDSRLYASHTGTATSYVEVDTNKVEIYSSKLVEILGNVTLTSGPAVNTIENTITDDNTHLPTSGAVVDHSNSQPRELYFSLGLNKASDTELFTATDSCSYGEFRNNTGKTMVITSVHGFVKGSVTPDIVSDLRYNAGIPSHGTGTLVETSGFTINSTAEFSQTSGFENASIPANSWVWMEPRTVTEAPQKIVFIITYTLQ